MVAPTLRPVGTTCSLCHMTLMMVLFWVVTLAPLVGLVVSMIAVGCEFAFNAIATRPEMRPESAAIPRRVDLREMYP